MITRFFMSEKAMASHSSTLAWKIPWMEEPGRLQSMGVLRVWHEWATSLSLFTFMHWRRKWQPTPVFLPGESQGLEVWWAAIYGVAQSRTRLKQHSINIVTLTKILLDFLKCQCCKNFKKYLILYVINTWIKYLQHWSKFTTKPAICNCVELYENSNLEVYLYLIPRLFILAM